MQEEKVENFKKFLRVEKVNMEKLSAVPSQVQAEVELYTQAKNWLGANYLTLSPAAKRRLFAQQGAELSQLLAKEEILVFNAQSVKNYQQAMVEHSLQNEQIKRQRKRKNYRALSFTLPSLLGMIALFSLTTLPFIYVLPIATIISFIVFLVIADGKKEYYYWQRWSLSQYSGSIPAAQLIELALRVRQKIPQAKLWVEEFSNGQNSLPNLFLIVGYGDMEYYLAAEQPPTI